MIVRAECVETDFLKSQSCLVLETLKLSRSQTSESGVQAIQAM